MTPAAAFAELLARVGAGRGQAVLLSDQELTTWPADMVATLKTRGLLTKARPAASTTCGGCEYQCTMPVHVVRRNSEPPEAFIVCDKRSDINRVPVALDLLRRWQASGQTVASVLASLLGLNRSAGTTEPANRWDVGVLKGAKHASHVVLVAEGNLLLALAGYRIDLTEVLAIDGTRLTVDRRALNRLVDHPAAGGGDTESAEQRRIRYEKRVQFHKERGSKSFLKDVAEEEGISISRVKQVLAPKPPPPIHQE